MSLPTRESTVAQVVDLLTRRFPDESVAHVTETVREGFDALDGSPIRLYVTNLVEHAARTRLTGELAAAS